jgi:catechol 2,3-dioxygenase-like lactoylglutathione lyase family enzyme
VTVRIGEISIDCRDPAKAAEFWCSALGYRVSEISDDEGVGIVGDPTAPTILFLRTDDPKPVKNRIHFDVSPVAGSDRDTEVERLERLGASRIDIGQPDDVSWVVMADPDGNEFCVMSTVIPPEPHAFHE